MKTIIKLLFPAVLTAGMLLPASAQQNTGSPMKLTLDQAINYALENNANIKNAKIDLESAKKKIWETTALGLPQVNASATYTNNLSVPIVNFGYAENYSNLPAGNVSKADLLQNLVPQSFPLTVKQNIVANISASQLIFSGEYIVGLQASRTFKNLSEQILTKSKDDVRQSVKMSYFLVLILRERLEIFKKSLLVADQTLKDVTAMNIQGVKEATDVDQEQLTKLNIENSIFALEGNSKVATRSLNFLIGVDLDQYIELTDSIGSFTSLISPEALMNDAFIPNDNIDYKLLQTQEALSLLSLKREKSKYLPSINASFVHQEILNAPLLNFSIPNMLNVSLSWQLFSSGVRNSRIQQARLALDKASLAKSQAEQRLMLSYQGNHNNYITALNNYFRLKKNVELSDNIYKKTLIKYQQGIATSTELTLAQNQDINTETAYYGAILELLNAKAALENLFQSSK
jgi:outer membrane protein TolC